MERRAVPLRQLT